jgi:hypothetical protein
MLDTGRTSIPELQKPRGVVEIAQDPSAADSWQTEKLLNGSRSGRRKGWIIEDKYAFEVREGKVAKCRKIVEREFIRKNGKLLDVSDDMRRSV